MKTKKRTEHPAIKIEYKHPKIEEPEELRPNCGCTPNTSKKRKKSKKYLLNLAKPLYLLFGVLL
jgi:hypothetical protein